jgi:hypothetical protein
MIDVILLAEIGWCIAFLRTKGIQRALLLNGGVLTAGYVAYRLSDWLTNTFLPQASPVWKWVMNQIELTPQNVSGLANYIPPLAAATGGFTHSQWIAYHIVRALFYVSITAAVFMIFLVVGYLVDGLWDHPVAHYPPQEQAITMILSGACGAYVAIVTGILIADLSWLSDFKELSMAATHSLGVFWIGHFVKLVL